MDSKILTETEENLDVVISENLERLSQEVVREDEPPEKSVLFEIAHAI